MKNLWFKAKKYYGWGWYPARWQGWVVLLVWLGLVIFLFGHIDATSHSASDTLRPFSLNLILMLAVLTWVCWRTGERPQWRWAGKEMSWQQVMLRIAGIIVLAFAVGAVTAWLLAR
jgi:hypothetical protein